jgi:hypothetical protein
LTNERSNRGGAGGIIGDFLWRVAEGARRKPSLSGLMSHKTPFIVTELDADVDPFLQFK